MAKEIFANSNSKKKKKDEDELFYRVSSYARQKALSESRGGSTPLASAKEPVGKTQTKPTVSSTVGNKTTYTERAKQAGQKNIRANTMTEAEKQAARTQYTTEKSELAKQRMDVQRKTVAMKRSGGMSGIDGKELEAERKRIEARMAELDSLLEDLDKPEYVSHIDELNEIVGDTPAKQHQISSEYGNVNPRRDPEQFRLYHAALAAANNERLDAQRELDWIDYINKYNGKTYTEIENADSFGDNWKNFWQQGGANKTLGRIGQDTNKAFGTYAASNKQVDEDYAKALAEVEGNFMERNAAVLDDEGQVLPLLSKTAAGYIPQLVDQTKAGAIGAIPGALIGFALQNPVQGAKIGASVGSGFESFKLMSGAAFRELLNAGVDEETARAAAMDEGFVSALIESGSTYASLSMMGIGKGFSALGNAAKTAVANGSKNAAVKVVANIASKTATKSAAKAAAKGVATKSFWTTVGKVGKGVTMYGLNAGGEMLEEGLQKGVSIANVNRAKDGETGAGNLAWETMKTFGNVIAGKDSESASAIWEDAKEGGKIALMFGGATMATNTAITAAINNKTAVNVGKRNQPFVDAIIEQGLTYGDDTTAHKIASKLKGKEKVSDADLGRLVFANELAQADSVVEGYTTNKEALTALIEEGKGYGGEAKKIAENIEKKVNSGKTPTTAEIEKLIAVNTVYFDPDTHTVDTASTVVEAPVDTSVEAPVQSRMQTISTRLAESGMETAQAETVAQSLDRILSGDHTVTGKDKDVLAVGNKEARAIFEEETGTKLPATNAATRKVVADYITKTAISQQGQETAAPNVIAQETTETVSETISETPVDAETTLRQAAQDSVVMAQPKADMNSSINLDTLGEHGKNTFQRLVSKAPNVEQFSNAFKRYYEVGMLGLDFKEITTAYDHGISRTMLFEAYSAGQNDATVTQKANTPTQKKNARKGKNKPSMGKGTFYDSRTSEGKSKNTISENVIKALDRFAKTLNIDIELRDTIANSKGESFANGYYDPVAKKIYIAADSENPLMTVLKHEVTHHIQRVSPAKYEAYKNYVMKAFYNNSKEAMDFAVQTRINKANENGYKMTISQAMDEIVADATEEFLTDRDSIDALVRENRSLGETILNAIRDVLHKIEAALKGEDFKGYSYVVFRDDVEKMKQAEKLWVEALMSATTEDGVGIQYDSNSESFAPVWSLKTWNESEYVKDREASAKVMAKQLGITKEQALAYIDDINSVAKLIADDRIRLDYESNMDAGATVLKANSEYKYTVDMSTLCAKRLLFTGTFDAIQKAMPNTVFDSEDIVRLREMMMKRNLEVACGICYVESTRREIGRITQDFIDRYKLAQKTGKPITRLNSEGKVVDLKKTKDQMGTTADKSTDKFFADKDYTPTLADLNTTDIDLVKRDHPLVYEAYLNFMNARGQAKPKLLETRAEYKGEILKHFKAKSAVNARNAHGGLRLQSFSDFEVPHLIDMMQVITDMSRVGLKSQAYTKVPAFAAVFGGTGVKINLSLIAKGDGIDAKGNLIFDDVEGMNHKEAFRLREQYSENVGTILVGKNDAHIIAAMADPRIDFIIPFHKSSWKESLYDALGLTGYADYTETQNEKPIDKDRKISNFDPSEYWDFSKTGDENAQIYLAKCREDGRTPKFPQFQGYPGYWKLLTDFKMYNNDGVGSPQTVVRPDFNMDAATDVLNDYKGGHRSFPVAQDVVDDFVSEYKAQKNTTEDGGVQYSYKESFASDVSTWDRNGRPDDEQFVLGTTGDVLQGLGAIESDIYMHGEKVNTILNDHPEMSIDIIKRVPQILENPVLILKSRNVGRGSKNNTRMVIFGSVKAENGLPVMAVLDLRPVEGDLVIDDMQKVTSAYTKTTSPIDFVRNSEVLFANKKRTTRLLRSIGFHMPIELLRSGSVGSITYSKRNVNMNGVSFSAVVRERQQEGQFSYKDSTGMESDLTALRQERADLEEQIDMASLNGLSDVEIRKLNNRMTKVNAEIDKIVAEERRAVVKTPMQTILDNLGNYRRSDLESLAEQISEGAWDGYEDLSRTELEDALREEIENRELNALEMQNKKFGLYVRPVEDALFQYKDSDESLEISKQIAEAEHKAKAVTDAEIMSQKLKSIAKTDEEMSVVRNYQNAMKKLADYEKDLAVYDATKAEHEKGRSIYTDASGKVKKSGVKYSAAEKAEIQRKIELWKRNLKDIERKEAFKRVLKREKAKMAERHAKEISDLRAKYDERLATLRSQRDAKVETEKQRMRDYKQHQRDSKEYKALKAKLEAEVKWLSERLVHPTDAKHIPEDFKKVVATFLESLDFTTKGMDKNIAKTGEPSKKYIKMWSMIEAYQKIAKDDSSNIELTPIEKAMMDSLKESFENGRRVEDLDYNELNMVYDIIRWIKTGVAMANKTFNEKINETVSELGDDAIFELGSKGVRKEFGAEVLNEADKLLFFDNVAPADMFHRFGGVLEKMYGEIRKGFNKHIENVRTAISEVHKLTNGHEEEIKKWSNTAKVYHLSDGDIELTQAQVMSLYVLMKREQAKTHIIGNDDVIGSGIVPSGVVIKEAKPLSKLIKKEQTAIKKENRERNEKKFSDKTIDVSRKIAAHGCQISYDEVQRIVGELNEDQKRIADGIVTLFTTKCADWGNEASMRMLNTKKFTEKNYFPIKSSDAFLNERFDDGGDVLIKNLGFTKNTVTNATNPIVVDDIFNVLTDHVNKMSMYNALVVPLTDFTKVYNYKQKTESGKLIGVKDALEKAHGTLAADYVTQFMKDVNKQANALAAESFGAKNLARFKKAKIGMNLRVLVQQPTSIVRAVAMVDPKYLAKGIAQKANYEELFTHSEIAYWKHLGFFETDTARSMKDILMGNEKLLDKVTMDMYGKADDLAWMALWNAIKLEQADAHPDMDTTSSEFMDLVKDRFEKVVDRTQVVDSVFHRSQLMRSKSVYTKMVTAFMSEPTKAYNLLMTDLADARKTKNYSQFKRTLATYVASAVITSWAAAWVDALRDDEDEDEEGKKRGLITKQMEATLANMLDNIIPMNLVPYAKDIWSTFAGYDVTRTDMASYTNFSKAMRKLADPKYKWPYKCKVFVEAVTDLCGVPAKNAWRDLTGIVRTTGNLFGGNYFGEYWVEKSHYDITDSKNRSTFYKHYTDALLAGDEKAADKIYKDMVLNGIPSDNIIAKGYQVQKKAAFSEAQKLVDKGKTDEAKDVIRNLAKANGKKYTDLWKTFRNTSTDEPEKTYDFDDLKKAVKRGKDTDAIEDYLTEYGGWSEKAVDDAIKMLTGKYR